MHRPPQLARLLLKLLPSRMRSLVQDDLDEEFAAALAARGGRAAKRAYVSMVVRSVVDVAWAGSQARLGGLVGLGGLLAGGVATDLRLAGRSVRRTPLYAAAVVGTLGLGIGANTAVFSATSQVLFHPLPLRDATSIVVVRERLEGAVAGAPGLVAPAAVVAWRREARSLSGVAWGRYASRGLTADGARGALFIQLVSDDFLDVLGAPFAQGRDFRRGEGEPGTEPVLIATDELWEELGGGPLPEGRFLELDGVPHRVVGVLEAGFRNPADISLPRAFVASSLSGMEEDRATGDLFVHGRLQAGAGVEDVERELAGISESFVERDPGEPRRQPVVEPLRSFVSAPARSSLLLLMAGCGFLLLLACANLANVVLTRAIVRGRDMDVRRALGAGAGHIFRMIGMEHLVLGAGGAMLGTLLALWSEPFTRVLIPERLAGGPYDVGGVDPMVLSFTLLTTLLVTLVMSLLSARHALRARGTGVLGLRGASTGTGAQRRLRDALVIGEVVLAFALVSTTGLLVRSAAKAGEVPPGFDSEGILTFRVGGGSPEQGVLAGRADFFERIRDRVAEVPGVLAVAGASALPPEQPFRQTVLTVPGAPPTGPGNEPRALLRAVMPGYFEALGIAIVSGEAFTEEDRIAGSRRVVLSLSAARGTFGDENPTGASVLVGTDPEPMRVLGVVADVRSAGTPPDPLPVVYVPHATLPQNALSFAVRVDGDPAGYVRAIQDAVWAEDEVLSIYEVETMGDRVASFAERTRAVERLLALFSTVAVIFLVTGVFSVVSFSVSLRTREIGVRVAVGARPGDVVRSLARVAIGQALIGLAGGVAVTLAVGRLLGGLVYGVGASDPPTLLSAGALVLVTVALAGLVPSLRATRIHPVQALRE